MSEIEEGAVIGVVVIGRNEGARLAACLDSVPHGLVRDIVYVDSGSTDDSVALAQARGVGIVHLCDAQPFTAARARNAGYEKLQERAGADLEFVQFIDGDCLLQPAWFDHALAVMRSSPTIGFVCGRRREQHPQESLFNRLCDMEWNTPVGEAHECGGDFLCRTEAFEGEGGFDDALIAGEEPDLCLRARRSGWRIVRTDCEMTLHDARIRTLTQWYRRTLRGGYAFMLGALRHGAAEERFRVRNVARAAFWGGLLPACTVVAMLLVGPLGAVLLAAYPAKIGLLWWRLRGSGETDALPKACLLAAGNVVEFLGAASCLLDRARRSRRQIIEYK